MAEILQSGNYLHVLKKIILSAVIMKIYYDCYYEKNLIVKTYHNIFCSWLKMSCNKID